MTPKAHADQGTHKCSCILVLCVRGKTLLIVRVMVFAAVNTPTKKKRNYKMLRLSIKIEKQ